jgi:hypothetical protein
MPTVLWEINLVPEPSPPSINVLVYGVPYQEVGSVSRILKAIGMFQR